MTHYDTLGVAPNASENEIKSAYRTLAKKHHPDTGGDEETLKTISEAYNSIKTIEKRQDYDAELSGGNRHFNVNSENMKDIFRNMFGEQLDRQYHVRLTLEEAYEGKEIIINHQGTPYPIKIPGGVDNNMTMRVAGLGAVSQDGRNIGDLVVVISIDRHPIFARGGTDLEMVVDIPYLDCILGTKTKLSTLNKSAISLTIPECTKHGTRLRIKRHGMKFKNGETLQCGDLYVVINSVMPKALTDKEKEILLQMRKESDG